jgi:hypothetical protein
MFYNTYQLKVNLSYVCVKEIWGTDMQFNSFLI